MRPGIDTDTTSNRALVSRSRGFRLFGILIVSLSLFVGGCSSTKLLYNQIDWLTVWYLDDYFDLDSDQEDELRDMVRANLDWHRQTQLPRYAEFLREVELQAQSPVTPEMAEQNYWRVIDFWDDFMLHIVPDSYRFLTLLSDEQISELFENLEESNQEMYEEYSGQTAEQREANRNRVTIKMVQRFTGKLNKEQKLFIAESLDGMQDASEDWVKNRREWQVQYRHLLESRPPKDEYIAELERLFATPRSADTAEYQERIDHNLEVSFDMTSTLLNDLTDKQRKRMRKRFMNLAEDFDALSAGS
ncbi:MAG: DUF6279 family lipoprotein [Gammaproteobacteria bacterium]